MDHVQWTKGTRQNVTGQARWVQETHKDSGVKAIDRSRDDDDRSLYTVVNKSKNGLQVVAWGVKKHNPTVHITPHAIAKPQSRASLQSALQ